jgi:alkylation response protein AidB-like acyl-CoA dehydrogenase
MDVEEPRAPEEYESFRQQVRLFIAGHAPPPPRVKKAGLRTPENKGEVEALQRWILRLTEAGFGPMALAQLDDPWPARIAAEELQAADVPYKIGNTLVETALEQFGTPEQQGRYLPRLRNGQDIWCQLFSEPEAGSDLASLQTRAVRDGDVYRINGQKVWTTWGQWSDHGFLLARSNPAGKHAGISAFIIDMRQPGVDVRPMREITGTSDFNEVFFTDAVVPAANLIGADGEGWRVATASLSAERGGQGASEPAMEGQVLDLVRLATHGPAAATPDAVAWETLVKLYERAHILKLLRWRAESKRARGQATVSDAPIVKISFSTLFHDVAEEALRLLGHHSVLVGDDERATEGDRWQDMFLYSRAYTIAAGSNEIMRNVIAERALGMPREAVGNSGDAGRPG